MVTIFCDHCNETVGYKRFLRTDAYGKPVYARLVRIPCRVAPDRTKVYTAIEVFAQDAFVLDGKETKVVTPSPHTDWSGAFDHCEARL